MIKQFIVRIVTKGIIKKYRYSYFLNYFDLGFKNIVVEVKS